MTCIMIVQEQDHVSLKFFFCIAGNVHIVVICGIFYYYLNFSFSIFIFVIIHLIFKTIFLNFFSD
jgi:hypothetical protein